MKRLLLILMMAISFATSLFAQENLKMFKQNGKWGFEDEISGKIVIPAKFDNAWSFSEGLAAVKLDGKYGFIDKTGEFVIPPKFEDALSFSEGVAAVELDGKYGYIDKSGEFVIPTKFKDAWSFSEGLAKVQLNGKWGFIDKSGELVIPAKFDDACSFREGLAAVNLNGKWGYIDNSGKFVIPAKFDNAWLFSEGLAMVNLNGKWGFIDKSGELVIPAKFDDAYSFREGLAKVKLNGKWGYIDNSGKFVIPAKFDNAWSFSEGLAMVNLNGKWGFIDKSGELVIPAKFDDACSFREGLAKVKLNGKWGYIDKTGNFYNSIEDAREAQKNISSTDLRSYIASIGSYEDFMAKKGIIVPTEENLKSAIEREIAEWQKKGEFEKTADYQQRVNEQTRTAKVKEIADRLNKDYLAKRENALAEYKEAYNKAVAQYLSAKKYVFAQQALTLQPYDADNETFLIHTERDGDILLPVPIDEATAFKNDWENIKKGVKSEYVAAGDNVALKSVTFGKYTYDSNTKGDYAQVDINYNFKPIDISNISLDLGNIDQAETKTVSKQASPGESLANREVKTKVKTIEVGSTSDVDRDIPQSKKVNDRTFAIVIANGNYEHASKVENAANDGKIVTKYLTSALGIPEKNITTCIDATFGQTIAALTHLKDIARAYANEDFNVIFYYSGHGFPDERNQESYILPVDGLPSNTSVCYPLKQLYTELGNLGAKRVTVMIDACFSGANHGDGMLIAQAKGVAMHTAKTAPVGNMVVLTASQGDETAYPYSDKGHGLFTYWLLKKMQESKGNVTLGELSDFVKDNVCKVSVIENKKLQTPSVATSASLSGSWRSLPLVEF